MTSRTTLLAFLALSVAVPAAAHDVKTLDGYADFGKPSWAEYERPMEVILDRVKAFPESLEGRPALEVNVTKNDDENLVVDLKEFGLLDDAVDAIHTRYIMHEAYPGSFHLIGYGQKLKCRRSADPNEWGITACP